MLANQRISREKNLNVIKLGVVDYGEAYNLQKQLLEEHIQGKGRDSLLLLQHNPVITIGRSGSRDNILIPESALTAAGIETYETDRGGDVTYHGPGQLIGYPIINLRHFRKDVHWYLRRLEETIIKALAEYGITGERMEGYTGVWVGNEKIAAIGVGIKRWITYHGFALNVYPDMSHFQMIRPCGIIDKGVTSVERLLGYRADMDKIAEKAVSAFAEVLDVNCIHTHVMDVGSL